MNHELLAKNEVLKKEPATSAEESKNCTNQESNAIDHARVLTHLPVNRNAYPVEITGGQNCGEGRC